MSVSGSFIWPAQHPCVTWGDAHSLCLRWPGSPMSLTQTSHPEYLLSWNVCAGITGSLAKYRCRDEECDGCQCPESSTPAIFTTWLPVANWDEPAGALWSRDHSGPIRGRCSLVTWSLWANQGPVLSGHRRASAPCLPTCPLYLVFIWT